MKTKPHIIVLLAALMLACIITPASAYTLLGTFNHGNTTATWGSWAGVAPTNKTAWNNTAVSHLEWEGNCTITNVSKPLIGSVYADDYYDGVDYGHVTVSWDVAGYNVYDSCAITIDVAPDHVWEGTDSHGFYSDGTTTHWALSYYAGITFNKELTPKSADPYDWDFYYGGNHAGGTYRTYNGSVVVPTPTPEPTVAPGYVRNTFETVSATTNNMIHGSNIMLYDTYLHVWKNSTSDADGMLYIDTLPYTVVNAYATYTIFANEFADAELLGTNVGTTQIDYQIKMYPISSPPPAGYVNLFVTTIDDNGDILRNVPIRADWGSPLVQHPTTSGTYGIATLVAPNNTQVHLYAYNYAGYNGAESVINTGPGTSYAATLVLSRQTVTPTATMTTGPGGTIPTTYAPGTGPAGYEPGYANTQGQYYMNWLAQNGFSLVVLCFLFTIIGLVKMAAK